MCAQKSAIPLAPRQTVGGIQELIYRLPRNCPAAMTEAHSISTTPQPSAWRSATFPGVSR